MNLRFVIAEEIDIPELTKIMTRTFDDDTQKHLGEPRGGPEGYDTGEFFQRCMIDNEASICYKIVLNNEIIGVFIVFIYEHGDNVLGTIFIDPEHQNMDIGSLTWQFIEKTYPDTKSWSLDTPSWAKRNHHFYEKKCGFTKVREEHYVGSPFTFFIFHKNMKESSIISNTS